MKTLKLKVCSENESKVFTYYIEMSVDTLSRIGIEYVTFN